MGCTCCVTGCSNSTKKGYQMHRFPRDPTLYNIWLEKVGRIDLKEKPVSKVREVHRVCDLHFSNDSRYVGTRNKSTIKKEAIPSLFLANPILSTSLPIRPALQEIQDFPIPITTTAVRISEQPTSNLLTSQEKLNNVVPESRSLPRCFPLKESLNISPASRTPECAKKPLVVLKINRNEACPPKENVGSSGIVVEHHPIANIPESTEIPLIVCDIDTGSVSTSSKNILECRTCLEIVTEANNISLETEVVAKITILEALKKLAAIQVPETDLLPQQICEKCFCNLQSAINFHKQIISSDEKLKSRLPLSTDSLLIKPQSCVIKTEELNTLEEDINKPLEDTEAMTFKMEIVDENIEQFISSETEGFRNVSTIEIGYNPEKEPILQNYLKRKYLYENGMLIEPPKKSSENLPPKAIVRPEYTPHKYVFRTPRPLDNSCLCSECGKIFKTKYYCLRHMRRIHDTMSRTSEGCLCPICGQMFNTRFRCQRHITQLHKRLIKKPTPTNYLCPNCGRFILGSRKKFLTHTTKCRSNKPKKDKTAGISCLCPECGKMFKTKRICTVHLRNVHGKNVAMPRKRDSLCPDCGRCISGSKKKFLAHRTLHHSNKVS